MLILCRWVETWTAVHFRTAEKQNWTLVSRQKEENAAALAVL
jgi:hypothetical protein